MRRCPAPVPRYLDCLRHKLFILVLVFLCCLTAAAQTTKVRGIVKDAQTGEPIPFAAVFFKDTTIGLTSDNDGKYNLETRDKSARVLCCQLLGYVSQEVPVRAGGFGRLPTSCRPVP